MNTLKSKKNLGSTIIKNLSLVGVKSFEDLQKLGATKIYLQLVNKYPNKTWPVCYYLYSLDGALTNKHWNDIGAKRKQELLKSVGL